MGIEQLDFFGHNKVDVAIMRLKEFEPIEGYYFADSYGKDSCATRRLLEMSGCKYETHHNHTGLDAPELVQLQGFPDNWTKYGLFDDGVKLISDTQRYKCCGNAVTTNVIRDIASEWIK